MPEPSSKRPRSLAHPHVSVNLPPAQWRIALAVLTSAQTMMDSAVHSAAVSQVIRAIASQTDIEVTPVEVNE